MEWNKETSVLCNHINTQRALTPATPGLEGSHSNMLGWISNASGSSGHGCETEVSCLDWPEVLTDVLTTSHFRTPQETPSRSHQCHARFVFPSLVGSKPQTRGDKGKRKHRRIHRVRLRHQEREERGKRKQETKVERIENGGGKNAEGIKLRREKHPFRRVLKTVRQRLAPTLPASH